MKKIFFLFAALVACTLSTFAHDFEVDGIYYNFLGGDSVEVTYYGDDIWSARYSGELSLQSTVTYNDITYRVTTIGGYAFYYCSGLTNISIPVTVNTIDERAFCGCYNLTSVNFLNNVTTIGNLAFFNCRNLRSITIPKSVTTIGSQAFSSCANIETIVVEDSNPIYHSVDNCLIKTKSKTLIIGCKNSIIPTDGSVLKIDNCAFQACRSTSMTIPNGVTTINSWAFAHCYYLTSITIPNSVNMISAGAFDYCNAIETITVESENPIYHSIGNCLIETAKKTLHTGCKNSIIPIDESVTIIGDRAFCGCSSLKSITIPNNITAIGEQAFYKCDSLISAVIGNSVTTIGEWAFGEKLNLTEITCLSQIPPTIQSTTFYGINRTILIYVPAESIEAYKAAEYWSEFTNIQAIPTFAIESVDMRVDKISLYPNEKYFLNTVVAPVEADKSTLIWTTSDADIATVDSTGFVTAHAVGTATITVATPDNTLAATCEVVVLDESQEPSDDVVVDPDTESVEISWTPVEGAAYYVFVVYADETQVTKICALTFNAYGHLTNINFLPKKPAITPEDNPFNFTVTGLEENTTYGYSMSSYDEEETLITSKAGQFTTTSNVVTGMETLYDNVSTEVSKVLENGTIYILRNGEKYTIDGRKVE